MSSIIVKIFRSQTKSRLFSKKKKIIKFSNSNVKVNEKGKSINANITMTKMLGLPDKDFIAAIVKMLQWTIVNTFETAEKNRKSHQRNRKSQKRYRRYKELNWNFRTGKNVITKILKLDRWTQNTEWGRDGENNQWTAR